MSRNDRVIYRLFTGKIATAVSSLLIGNTTGALDFLDLIRSRADISSVKEDLMFGAPMRKAA